MPDTKFLTVERLSLKELIRIFSKVEVDPVTKCWNWIASLNTDGYGNIWYKGRQEVAHRLIYAWLIEPLPMKVNGSNVLELDHIVCENPRCCNPLHVRLVTSRENTERTNSVSAVNRRKTHCAYGHKLPKEPNRPGGPWRMCIPCRRRRGYQAYLKRKARLDNSL